MASIQNPKVTLGNSVGTKRAVTVSSTLQFAASDVGHTYKLEIAVFGDDSATDQRPAEDGPSDDQIYTFSWPGPLLPRPYKLFTVQSAGNVALSETRMIDNEVLDEDKGNKQVGWADIHTPLFMPRNDEVYAKLTLGTVSISATTPTVQSGIGV